MTLDEAIKHCEEVSEHMEHFCGSAKSAVEYRQYAEWLKQVPRWISVKDRLPERHKTVLMYLQSDTNYISAYYEIGFYQPQKAKWYCEDLNYIEDCYTVTHWMPLPEPPESEE